AKMNEFCAAMGLCNLRHVQEAIESRKRIVDLYNKLLSGIPGIQLNVIAKNVESNYAYYPIVIHPEYAHCSRDDIFTALAENHIGARKYFYPLTSQAKYFQGKINPEETPVALRVSQRVLTLPLYEGLESEAVKEICSIIRNCVR
ncbi:MAG: DegT/DnrJ/EryC1/StrS family aminotransferase, partial [Muribaculaceae bacterium]|nr:DegT/DnrJ/EryC1/StrS family aminotransferase [Muribaculaceae bacterium]